MKKTIAAGGATLLGFSAAGLGAMPAHAAADPVVDPCLDAGDHALTVGGVSSNWYMDCIPQYTNAGVEFTITSEKDFPEGFLALNDESGAVTSSTTTSAAANDYFFYTPPPAGFTDMFRYDEGAQYQSYIGTMMIPVTSVGSIATAELPAGCAGGTYTGAYVVNYAPTTVSFTQTIDGEQWRYDVVATPQPLYLGLSVLDTGAYDPTGSLCAASGGEVLFGADAVDGEWGEASSVAISLTPYFGEGKSLPDVTRYVAPPPTPQPAAEPQLAPTGVDPSGTLGVAALFLALGVAGGVLQRRRIAD